jgi:hypothetical protein
MLDAMEETKGHEYLDWSINVFGKVWGRVILTFLAI